jgi:hypothetical protein
MNCADALPVTSAGGECLGNPFHRAATQARARCSWGGHSSACMIRSLAGRRRDTNDDHQRHLRHERRERARGLQDHGRRRRAVFPNHFHRSGDHQHQGRIRPSRQRPARPQRLQPQPIHLRADHQRPEGGCEFERRRERGRQPAGGGPDLRDARLCHDHGAGEGAGAARTQQQCLRRHRRVREQPALRFDRSNGITPGQYDFYGSVAQNFPRSWGGN